MCEAPDAGCLNVVIRLSWLREIPTRSVEWSFSCNNPYAAGRSRSPAISELSFSKKVMSFNYEGVSPNPRIHFVVSEHCPPMEQDLLFNPFPVRFGSNIFFLAQLHLLLNCLSLGVISV
jgi:hypothetical protein